MIFTEGKIWDSGRPLRSAEYANPLVEPWQIDLQVPVAPSSDVSLASTQCCLGDCIGLRKDAMASAKNNSNYNRVRRRNIKRTDRHKVWSWQAQLV